MSVNVNTSSRLCNKLIALAIVIFCGGVVCFPQTDAVDEVIVPFEVLLKRPVEMKPELKGVHPRLFYTDKDIAGFRTRAKGIDKALWVDVVEDIKTLKRDVPDPKDPDLYKSGLDKRKKGAISQYTFAFQIAQTSFAYVIEQDERYLDAAKKWTLAACEMEIWGYTYNKPNVDLPPAHLLYAVAFAYDTLFDKLSKDEKLIIKNKLIKQSRLMYDYFKYKPKKRYTYSQNHTWIPITGLAVAAYVLMDETDEAKDWARLSRSIYERTMTTFAPDGFFYESFHYFGFAFRWMIRYFDVHKSVTGEDLYAKMRPKFERMKYFAMHSILPDRENVFDIADIGDGSLNRNGESKRESIYSEYDILYRFAGVYRDSHAQTIGDFLRSETKLKTREPMWGFINHDSSIKPAKLSEIPLQVHFDDNDTVYWRSDWSTDATAFVFRASPPEGHHAAKLAGKISDWRQNTGHAHPDANSFIVWAKGKYLTGDTGYLGIKQTDDHNTILINGRGQANDGAYEMFKEVPNEKLNKIHIAEINSGNGVFYARGESGSAYYDDLGVKRFTRHFLYVEPDYFVVWDEVETKEPSTVTFMLNADREIKRTDNNFDLINGDAALAVFDLGSDTSSEIVDQKVQARGLPGSVSKGDMEIRGKQLRISTTEPSAMTEMVNILIPHYTGKDTLPKVAKVGSVVSVTFADGRSDEVHLKTAEAGKSVLVRRDAKGKAVRMLFRNAKN